MELYESEELYLETIFLLKQKNNVVKTEKIAKELGFANTVVATAISLLVERGYIYLDDAGQIEFTLKGNARATEIYDKHKLITEMFVKMGVERGSAEENAGKIVHLLSEDIIEVIRKYFYKI